MRMWTGQGVYQWENSRSWVLNGASEYCRGDGALVLPGFNTFSVFFRKQSQTSGSTFTLLLHTAPIYFKLLDDLVDSQTAPALMYELSVTPTSGLTMTGTAAKVYGARIAADQPMGSVLFWEVRHTGTSGTLVGDIYVVPNFEGAVSSTDIRRTVDVQANGGSSGVPNSLIRAR